MKNISIYEFVKSVKINCTSKIFAISKKNTVARLCDMGYPALMFTGIGYTAGRARVSGKISTVQVSRLYSSTAEIGFS